MRRVALLFVGALLVAGVAECQTWQTELIADQTEIAGTVDLWNTRTHVYVAITPDSWYLISECNVYAGVDPVPTTPSGNPIPGWFPFRVAYEDPADFTRIKMDIVEDLGLPPNEYPDLIVAVHCELVGADGAEAGAWAYGNYLFDGSQWGWWFVYDMASPTG